MNWAYIRFSTDKQDETQQMQAISEFAKLKGIAIDAFEKDEGVSGGVSYRDRKLLDLVRKMRLGDVLIVSEISRLGRSMSDLNRLISDELKPRKARLIVIKMGIDMDCSHLTAVDEMILFSLSFAAQVEKEMIQQRTQSSIDAKKALLLKNGGFMSKSGQWCTRLGNKPGTIIPEAITAMSRKRSEMSDRWKQESPLYTWVTIQIYKGRKDDDIIQEAGEMYERNPEKYCTRNGRKLGRATYFRWKREILLKN